MKKWLAGLVACAVVCATADVVSESARDLPRLADVDVVVVGGTAAGVHAAAAAKAQGASVFLVAPRFQLGEELVTTRSLWQNPRDEGKGDAFMLDLFSSDRTCAYSYSYNRAPNSGHADNGLSVLKDGSAASAASESVQFDGAVTITAALSPDAGPLNEIRLSAYRRASSGGFVTGSYTVEASADGTSWTPLAGTVTVENRTLAGQSDTLDVIAFRLSAPVDAAQVRLSCPCASGFSRQLLGELAFVTENSTPQPTRPLVVAKALDKVLLDAGVPFLTGAPVCDVLRDASGRVAGVAVANRNGRQAIRAKVVVDATEWAAAARAAGVPFASAAASTRFSRVVVCEAGALDALRAQEGWSVEERLTLQTRVTILPGDLKGDGAPDSFAAKTYVVSRDFPLSNLSYADWLAAERQMRDATWCASLAEASEKCAFTPPDRIAGRASVSAWPGADTLPLDALRPAAADGLFVLGPCADVARADASRLQLVGIGTLLGRRVGAAAAAEAAATSLSGTVGLGAASAAGSAQVRERLTRPLNVGTDDGATVPSAGAALPVLADVDVLVVGGGTAGVPAALAAAGAGRRVVLAEILYNLGGVPVDNRIGRYYHGNRRGFATTLAAQAKAHGWMLYASSADWQRQACAQAGADLWFGAFAEGVVTDGVDAEGRARVAGVVLVLPDGTRGVVRARATIDATGNADLTAAAGGATTFLDNPEFAAQGVGASNIQLGSSYLNTDVGFLNDADAGDLSFFMLRSRLGLSASWMQPTFPSTGSRERRRIVGDVTVTELDVVRGRTWPDTVMHGKSNYDMHGFSTSPLFMFYEHPSGDTDADLPFRALLPAGLEGLLATGLGISATRDAMPILRMQPDVMNQGWAAGLAAAAASGDGASLRAIDVKALQRALVEADMLDARVLTDADGGAVAEAELDAAVAALTTNYHGLETILAAAPETALPKLRAAYADATATARRKALGTVLALLGDATAVDYLLEQFPDKTWDTGYQFRGMGNYGRQTSGLDFTLYALSRTHDPRVLPLLGSLGAALADADASVRTLSHFRMYNLAVREYPLAALAAPVAGMVANAADKLQGNAVAGPVAASYDETVANAERTAAVRELALAETLLRLGDPDGSGRRSLEAFARDPRASYAEWARKLLATEIPAPIADVDAVWTATAGSGLWTDSANWLNGLVPEGSTSTATFTGLQAGAAQTVEIPQAGATVGSLLLADGADRTFAGGGISLLAPEAVLDVLGGTTTFLDAFAAQTVVKSGAGAVTFAGPVDVSTKLTVDEGTVSLANGASVREVSAAAFSVAEGEDAWLTHLGCPAADVAALEGRERIRVRLVRKSNGKTATAVLFTRRTRGVARGGTRFLRLGAPLRLDPGSYELRVSEKGTAPAALVASREPMPSLHRVRVDGRLDLASPIVSAVALTGTGVVSAVTDQPANLQLEARSGSFVFEGALGEADGAGPLSLVKLGDSTATLHGVESLRDGVSALRGVLTLDSPAALDPDAPFQFGSRDASIGAKGTVAFSAAETVVSNPVVCARMNGYNALGNGFRSLPGHRLTLRDMEVTAGDSVVDEGGVDGMFSLVPDFSATEETRVDMDAVELPYLDFTVQVNGEARKGRGLNAADVRNISAPDGLRKFTVLNVVSNSVGGAVRLMDSFLNVGWLDFTGPYVGFNLSTGATVVANNVRFPNSNSVQHSNAEILIDGGARLVANGLPTAAGFQTTNTVVRFDGAVLQLKSDHAGDFLALSDANPPCEVLAGGLTFDLAAYDVVPTGDYAYRSLRLRHPMASPVAGVPGPLTVLGGDPAGLANGGEVKLSAPMAVNGPVTVKGGALVCDFAAAPALANMFTPGIDLVLDGGAFLLQAGAAGKSEAFATVTNAAAAPARIEIADGCTVRAAALTGPGGYAVKGGALALELTAQSAPLDGPLALDGTVLTVATESVEVPPAPVAAGGFEPVNALPEPKDGNTSSLDKRGERDAAWLKTNLPDWTFDNDNNVGAARTGSYFTTVASDGVTCLFLRGTSGTVRQTFTVEAPARYSLVFDWKSRVYNNSVFNAKINVYCDGKVVHTTDTVKQAEGWLTTTVDLGTLEAGAHEIGFGSCVASGDALVDNVRLGYEAKVSQAELERLLPPELELDLRNGAQVRLDFEGRLPVSAVRVDGAKRYGVFSASTMPAVFSGTGSLVCQPTSTVIIFR